MSLVWPTPQGISPNGGMLALPLHRAQETLAVARADACPASEQLVRIQLN
jgi:hypothetical protein